MVENLVKVKVFYSQEFKIVVLKKILLKNLNLRTMREETTFLLSNKNFVYTLN